MARYLPDRVGELLYQYLVYIQPRVCMLGRVCLNVDKERPALFVPAAAERSWTTTTFSQHLRQFSQGMAAVSAGSGAQLYRQLSIATAEEHAAGAFALVIAMTRPSRGPTTALRSRGRVAIVPSRGTRRMAWTGPFLMNRARVFTALAPPLEAVTRLLLPKEAGRDSHRQLPSGSA